jgi:endonuclease G, mitochondrial
MLDRAAAREALARLMSNDTELAQELDQQLKASRREAATEVMTEGVAAAGTARAPLFSPETIVLRTGRPVLAIRNDLAIIEFTEKDSEVWRTRLNAAQARITPAIRSVGRVEVQGHDASWLGTGWLVEPDVIVTNRHVAEEFGRSSDAGFVFRRGVFGTMSANLDFLEEFGNTADRAVGVDKILHIEDEDGPDVAFLQLKANRFNLRKIDLDTSTAPARQQVAVIGYPARDSRIPDQDLMEDLFGNVYDKKRLAPGEVQAASTSTSLQHDCSTLGGNSGSVVLDLATGKAIGLHFAGRFLKANFAVPAGVVDELLRATLRGEARVRRVTVLAPQPGGGADRQSQQDTHSPQQLSCTIPINLTISVGAPSATGGGVVAAPAIHSAPRPQSPAPNPVDDNDDPAAAPDTGADSDEFVAEGVVADYEDRAGYESKFLDGDIEIPLPRIIENANQIVSFSFKGNPKETVLRYEHFSVVMRRDRRMCFYSAVNIDGSNPKKEKRTGWTTDPRLPKELQIIKECYGDAPRFSRGHMTRREDPVWGSPKSAKRGNSDSMHVTNAVPQMQTFNGGIWLGLEDYALDHTKEDDMRVSVFTGPVFRNNDPVKFKVKVPVMFWKVIAFLHDETGELSATGYTMSQAKFLSDREFVFGRYETHQRSLRSIEEMTGLSFGPLTKADLFDDTRESAQRPLSHPGQIRFR